MPKLCEKCGVDLDKKEHRPNCPTRKKSPPTDNSGLVINPAVQNDMTTAEVDSKSDDPDEDEDEDDTAVYGGSD